MFWISPETIDDIWCILKSEAPGLLGIFFRDISSETLWQPEKTPASSRKSLEANQGIYYFAKV